MKILNYFVIVAVMLSLFSCKNSNKTKKEEANMNTNPFLSEYNTDFNLYPFDKIKTEHYIPAFKEALKKHEAEIQAIIDNKEEPNFENVIDAFDQSGYLLYDVYNCFENINSANTNDTMQNISKEMAPILTKHFDNIALNDKLFAKIKVIYDAKETLKLTEEQQTVLEEIYLDFVSGGANLKDADKERFRKINEELALLTIKFEENVLAESNSYKLVIEKKEDLDGLSEQVIAMASETAKEEGMEGKWVFTLQNASITPFLQSASNRELRKQILTAYQSRCNNGNESDNKENIKQILKLRKEKAMLLGYKNHAEFIISRNMAQTTDKVSDLLIKVWEPALESAKEEAEALQEMIKKEGKDFKLEAWDWAYYSEKLKKEKYDLNTETLKPYFELNNVKEGLFTVVNKLYGLKIQEVKNAAKYHPDVTVYQVLNADGSHVGVVYFDLYARSSKGSGAWMNAFRKQTYYKGTFIAPVISMVCNFSKPTADNPSLLTYDEVQTLYHEFGHVLHGLFSKCNYYTISGTSVARDFVELPSQILENWATHPEVLKMYAKHYKTGEVIPQEIIERLEASSKYNQGFTTVEYVSAALLDMKWHTLDNTDNIDVNKFETETLNKLGLIPQIVTRYRTSYFKHIFSGSYSAGYYAYIWAEVIEADAFQAFVEKGIFDPTTANSFRENILSKGGSIDPMKLYIKFRGAEPTIEPLLKRRGLES